MKMKWNKKDLLFKYYEASVQSPEWHARWYDKIYRKIRNKAPRILKEDFCGTFKVACEWLMLGEDRVAFGLDLDPAAIDYGVRRHVPSLGKHIDRLAILERDVLLPFPEKVDVTVAANFSFFIFHQREQLKKYFKVNLECLNRDGLLILETAGGPGFIEESWEPKKVKVPPLPHETSSEKIEFVWEQQSFDPIQSRGHYAIHFKKLSLGNRGNKKSNQKSKKIMNAFTYDWRIWGVAELKDLLLEVGYRRVDVYWETTHRQGRKKGHGTGEFRVMKQGDNSHAWICYVVGVK